MTVPATSRIVRTFDDRADALAHFFQRAGEAPRLLAFDDSVGCPLDQAVAAIEGTEGEQWRIPVGRGSYTSMGAVDGRLRLKQLPTGTDVD